MWTKAPSVPEHEVEPQVDCASVPVSVSTVHVPGPGLHTPCPPVSVPGAVSHVPSLTAHVFLSEACDRDLHGVSNQLYDMPTSTPLLFPTPKAPTVISNSELVNLLKQLNELTQSVSELKAQVVSAQKKPVRSKAKVVCHGCHQKGHYARECPQRKSSSGSDTQSSSGDVSTVQESLNSL